MTTLAGSAFNSKHSRGPGGLFAAQSAAAGRPSGPWASGPMRYDPRTRRGTGYGMAGGDPRMRALQTRLNALGITDERGRELIVDGDLGPHSTAAIKKAQRQLGLKPDGIVTPQLMVAILTMRPASKPGTVRARMSGRPAGARPKPAVTRMAYATGTRTRAKAI